MHRFYLPPAECRGTVLSLTGREAHHALNVLRLRRGQRVIILDGQGQRLGCDVAQQQRDRLDLTVIERVSVNPPPCQIILAQAVPKGKLFEDIIEKATELGASRIVPLQTERTVGRFDQAEKTRKLDKWRQVAVEAIKQCGSAWLPLIDSPTTVEQFARQQNDIELPLVGALAQNARHPRHWFDVFAVEKRRKPVSLSIAIGPEGDFTPEELLCLQSAGARPITLGPLVLRTDTAAIYCLSISNYQLQA